MRRVPRPSPSNQSNSGWLLLSCVVDHARLAFFIAIGALLAGCPSDAPTGLFETASRLTGRQFFDAPFPLVTRTTESGAPDFRNLPIPASARWAQSFAQVAERQAGAARTPVVYFRFNAPVIRTQRDDSPDVADDNLLLVALEGPTRLLPVPAFAHELPTDSIVPEGVIAAAPFPGFVLEPNTTYAMIVRKAFAPEARPADALVALIEGREQSDEAEELQVAFAQLRTALSEMGLATGDVLHASVFHTGDPTAALRTYVHDVVARFDAPIQSLVASTTIHDGFCEVVGTIQLPQFQRGIPPFETEGDLAVDANGRLIWQRNEIVPFRLTLPTQQMPVGGWPLLQYVHGSGGGSDFAILMGPSATFGGPPEYGKGPAWVVAQAGIATATLALPLNPERVEGASGFDYLNLFNITAFPSTLQQGVIEQALFAESIWQTDVAASIVDACGVRLPPNEASHRFASDVRLLAGQSIGAAHATMLAATLPGYRAFVTTGSGGAWPLAILETSVVQGVPTFLAAPFGSPIDSFSHLHPAMALMGAALEPADPLVYMPEVGVARRDQAPPTSFYQPIGADDEFFSERVLNAAAIAQGGATVAQTVRPSLTVAMSLAQRSTATYPASENLTGRTGRLTGLVIPYATDGIETGHSIYRQLTEVKDQYRCFLTTAIADFSEIQHPAAAATCGVSPP